MLNCNVNLGVNHYILEELLCNNASSGIEGDLHLTNLLVNLLHELIMKQHAMKTGNQPVKLVIVLTCTTKSTSLCLYICSVWKLVIRKLIS